MESNEILQTQLMGASLSKGHLGALMVPASVIARSSGIVGQCDGLDLLLTDRVVFDGEGLFDFDRERYSFPAATSVFTCCARDINSEIVDVAAWGPDIEGVERGMWLGAVPVVGGEWSGSALHFGGSLPVYFSPLEWLQERRRGVLIINWELAGPYLGDRGPFLVGSVADGLNLRELLKTEAPKILVK